MWICIITVNNINVMILIPLPGGQLNGDTHFTKTTDEHDMSTVDQFLSGFEGFVGASFLIAEMLEDNMQLCLPIILPQTAYDYTFQL